MRQNIKLLKFIFFFTIVLLNDLRAELSNKVIISVGNEIITNYDLNREIKYLNVITLGEFKNLNNEEAYKIATDSLIKDKVKINELANHNYITLNDELIYNQINTIIKNIGFKNIDDFKNYLKFEKYKFDEFENKIIIELKWNQLIYQFYKNQIVIDKKKIDEKLKILLSKRVRKEEYLIYEIFIKNENIKKINNSEEKNEISSEEKTTENPKGDWIKGEIASYDNNKNLTNVENSEEKVKDVKKNNQITIEELLFHIKENGFKNTATQFSSSLTAEQEGSLGWVKESEFSEILLKFVKNLKKGQITDPITVSGGILLLKVEDRRVEEEKIDIEGKMNELVEIEKNNQLTQFSSNYFNQIKTNIKIKYFND